MFFNSPKRKNENHRLTRSLLFRNPFHPTRISAASRIITDTHPANELTESLHATNLRDFRNRNLPAPAWKQTEPESQLRWRETLPRNPGGLVLLQRSSPCCRMAKMFGTTGPSNHGTIYSAPFRHQRQIIPAMVAGSVPFDIGTCSTNGATPLGVVTEPVPKPSSLPPTPPLTQDHEWKEYVFHPWQLWEREFFEMY